MKVMPAVLTLVLLVGAVSVANAQKDTTAARKPRAANVLTAEYIDKFPNEPLEHLLSRRVSGIMLTRTSSGGYALTIRGVSSYTGELHPPLYIMNEMRVQAGSEGEMPSVDPRDVESITVLKGADAAIYGIDGANGVIVIKTKRAQKQ